MHRTDLFSAWSGVLGGAALVRRLVALAGLLAIAVSVRAWEHKSTDVEFVEYREGIIEELEQKGRPYFLLFSAEWCFWCHEFGENTLTDARVAEFLNANYTNVFIDADINSAAYVRYRATGLPFTVFLNPNASPHFRYAGTLYAEDFLTVIKQVKMNVEQGLSVEADLAKEYAYEPPEKLALAHIEGLGDGFRSGVVENFDSVDHGLGNGEKAVHPRTFMYLVAGGKGEARKDAIGAVHKAMSRAIERIYDPLEGGFFRYAETRDWKVPHYEKMADLNAGAVLLLFRLNDAAPTPAFVEAADKTLAYLRATLYDTDAKAFLSFQAADEHYYKLATPEHRSRAETPKIIRRIFIDRLAQTVDYLLDVLDYRPDAVLKGQLESSLDFVAGRLEKHGSLARYYVVENRAWSGKGNLQDYVLVARMFTNASKRLQSPRYRELARKTVDQAVARFLDKDLGVLVDPSLGETDDAEFLMEMNGLLAQTLIGLNSDGQYAELLNGVITYFSAIGEILEERLWEAQNWEFTERYVPYLRAVDSYLAGPKLAAQQQ